MNPGRPCRWLNPDTATANGVGPALSEHLRSEVTSPGPLVNRVPRNYFDELVDMGPGALTCDDALSPSVAGLGDMGKGDIDSHLNGYTRPPWSGHGHHTRDEARPAGAVPARCPV